MTGPGLADAYAHCEAIVKQADRADWLAALFAPAERRPALHALQAFLLEVGAVRTKVREPLAGELRLQWWTDAIEGEARGDVGGHPVAAALLDTIRTRKLPREALTDLIEAVREDLYDEPLADLAGFDRWADRRAGAALALKAGVLLEPAAVLSDRLRHAGRAAAVVAAIRALGRTQAVRAEVRLPLDLLDAAGLGPADVAARRMSPAIGTVVAQLARHAEREIAALRAGRAAIPDAAGPAFLTVNFVMPLLRQLARRGDDPFAGPLDLPAWRKQWILWRAARRNGVL